MIETLVTILHILTCLALILAILLQSGKGGGVSAAFGGGAGQALGQRGATTVLGRFTGIASATFMITSMILAIYSTSEYRDETLRDIPAAEETDADADKNKKAQSGETQTAPGEKTDVKKADADQTSQGSEDAPKTGTSVPQAGDTKPVPTPTKPAPTAEPSPTAP